VCIISHYAYIQHWYYAHHIQRETANKRGAEAMSKLHSGPDLVKPKIAHWIVGFFGEILTPR